ncbi:MAG: hypothetical protein IPG43_06230 [Proteobacteria bacterium]|nr:hypothetical protein [Pseudomonadota bacterium]
MIGRHATLEIHTRGSPLDVHWEGNIDARLDGINSDTCCARPTVGPASRASARQPGGVVDCGATTLALRHSDFRLAIEPSRNE